MVNTNTQCLYCNHKPNGIDAGIDNSNMTIDVMKKIGKVLMYWECNKCHKQNYFTVPWDPIFEKFI